jgi:hypothetical protein
MVFSLIFDVINFTKIEFPPIKFYFNLFWYSGYVGRRFQGKESSGCEKGPAETAD